MGDSGTILATTNGGITWKKQRKPRKWLSFYSVTVADALHAWAVGDTVLATSDGGAHWTKQKPGTLNVLNGVAVTDAYHGWTVGENGTILATSTGGVAEWAQARHH